MTKEDRLKWTRCDDGTEQCVIDLIGALDLQVIATDPNGTDDEDVPDHPELKWKPMEHSGSGDEVGMAWKRTTLCVVCVSWTRLEAFVGVFCDPEHPTVQKKMIEFEGESTEKNFRRVIYNAVAAEIQ